MFSEATLKRAPDQTHPQDSLESEEHSSKVYPQSRDPLAAPQIHQSLRTQALSAPR
jgi:hypothetical protein